MIIVVSPWILTRPFLGLLVMIAVNPFEALFPLPVGLSLGRLAGGITIFSWIRLLSVDQEASRRWQTSSLRSTIWLLPTVCVFSYFANLGSFSQSSAIGPTFSIVLFAMLSLMIENLVDSDYKLSQLMMAIVLSSFVAVLFPLAYHFGFDLYSVVGADTLEVVQGDMDRASGLTGNANALGMAASLGVFAVITGIAGSRNFILVLVYVALAFCMAGGLVLSASRTHFVALFVCISVFLALRITGPVKGRGNSILAASLLLLSIPVALTMAPERIQNRLILIGESVDESTHQRMNYANDQRMAAINGLRNNPLLGVGLLNFKNAGLSNLGAHDTVSVLVGETGLMGVTAFLIITWLCCRRLLTTLFVAQNTSQLVIYGYTLGLFAGFLAALVAGLGGYVVISQKWYWIVLGLSGVLLRFVHNHNHMQRNFYS